MTILSRPECDVCMSAIIRWAADAKRAHAPASEWRQLARVASELGNRHLDVPHSDYYVSLPPDLVIDTYEQVLSSLGER